MSWPPSSLPAPSSSPVRWAGIVVWCPLTCTIDSGRSVPEKTRTSDTRPTYASAEVRTTSAANGPSGSAVSGGCADAVHTGHRGQRVVQR